MTILPRTDVHQHLWSLELLAAVERRSEPPFARRGAGAWRLHVPGEPAATVAAQDQLVHGSDVPVVRGAAPGDDEALLRANPARLLG
jgi:hypothetical protein